jgi:dephospho-CoA kinase|tara:strand:+ start:116 stop:682 length:567 start_codon:yes stop_codon:yes gene_type:complete
MIKIGITGMLASGKSTVAKLISKRKYQIFNADNVVNKLYEEEFFKKKLKKIFKLKNTIGLKNQIRKLVKISKIDLSKLENFIHPKVREKMMAFTKLNRKSKLLVYEIPLLFESNLKRYFDKIIFVGAKKNIRLRRFTSKNKSEQLFLNLDKRQIKPSTKIKLSDYVIYNNLSLKNLESKVKFIINKYE